MSKVIESAMLLGANRTLVGILSRPSGHSGKQAEAEAEAKSDSKPAVVILNSGILHRVGANRMSVLLARALAAQGHLVLRFDLAGLGDSEPRNEAMTPIDSVMADLRDVLDDLESARQVKQVLLLGLCSGANHSIGYAALDPRVVGVVLIDPSIPRTTGYFMRLALQRANRLRSWSKLRELGKRGVSRVAGRKARRLEDDGDAVLPELQATADDPEARAWLEAAYRNAITARVAILAIFTGGLQSRLNYREQILDAFPSISFDAQMRLEYAKDSDHAFTRESDRSWLFQIIEEWTSATDLNRRKDLIAP